MSVRSAIRVLAFLGLVGGVPGYALAQEQPGIGVVRRSEEHTSELQSQSNIVCRLLLEKKKTTFITNTVNSAERTRHLTRKLTLRRRRNSGILLATAVTDTITRHIFIELITSTLGRVRL